MVALAFAIAIGATGALIATTVFLRDDESAPPPTPTPVVDLDRIPQDGTNLGSPKAKVTLIEYADLQCPACRSYALAVLPAIVERYVRPGRARTEFRGVVFLGPDSEKALRFVLAAGLQDRLWNLQEALYRHQGDENSGWVTDDLVRELAGEIPGLDVERMFEDADGAEVTSMLDEAAAQARAHQVPGTPTFFLQVGDAEPSFVHAGVDPDKLVAALDDALAG
jgi:protein-disulfide isomerase